MRFPVEIGRPQLVAAALLLLLGLACLLSIWQNSAQLAQTTALTDPAPLPVLVSRIASSLPVPVPQPALLAVIYSGFAVWLGGGVWWVSRRLFSNVGGYVATASYCTSLTIVNMAATGESAVLAAWAAFGFVYTAMGVAHTSYAPAYKWPPRVVLLAASFGLTLASAADVALVSLLFAFGFLVYLSPGVRRFSLSLFAIGVVAGTALALMLCALLRMPLTSLLPHARSLDLFTALGGVAKDVAENPSALLALPFAALLLAPVTCAAVLAYALWRRARWFGATSALLLSLGFLLVTPFAVPFLCVFTGSIAADWAEEPRFRWMALAAAVALAAKAALLFLAGAANS